MSENQKRKIHFSQHAIKRAHQRAIIQYLNKERFYFDGKYLDNHRVLVDDVVYAIEYQDGKTVITTMYKVPDFI